MTLREAIVAKAKTYLGTPYSKYDCSDLTEVVYMSFGVPYKYMTAASQAKYLYDRGLTTKVPESVKGDEIEKYLKVGDQIFWENKNDQTRFMDIHHTAIYIGNGDIIESRGDGVQICDHFWESTPWQIILVGRPIELIEGYEESEDEEMIQYTPGMAFDAETKEYQLSLIGLGFPLPKYGADGKFGGETLGAHNDFQVSVGLPKTKVVDVETQAAMFKAQREKSSKYSDEEVADMIKAKLNAEAELTKANNMILKAQSALSGF